MIFVATEKGKTMAELTRKKFIKQLMAEGIPRNGLIVADCAEPKSIEEIKRCGLYIIPSPKGADSIKNGLDVLRRYKIHITRQSRGIIGNMKKYKLWTWKMEVVLRPIPLRERKIQV